MSWWDAVPMEKCPYCGKPLVNESNLRILRYIILGGSTIGFGIAGLLALPLLGFTAAGVASGSAAAAWQASIGNVAAGSLFAVLQSLGTSAVAQLLFGAIGTVVGAGTGALGTLLLHAEILGFCVCPESLSTVSLTS